MYVPFVLYVPFCGLVSTASHQPQDEEEQVDEVEIERKRSDYGIGSNTSVRQCHSHLFQTLCIPGSQTGKHQHAYHVITNISTSLNQKILTTDAMIRPISPMNMNWPTPARLRFVNEPNTAIAPNIPPAITKAETIDAPV